MSGSFKLDMADLKKLGKNAVLVGVAASAAYASTNITSLDMGAMTAFIVPVITLVLQAVLTWAKDNTK